MDEPFVTLADWLADVPSDALPPNASFDTDCVEIQAETCIDEACDPLDDVVASVRRFRAMLDDAIETIRAELIADIAAGIIGREMQLSPVEIDRIVELAVDRYGGEPPLKVRAHPSDVERVGKDVPVVADAALRCGDVMLELRTGTIDARLGVRLERLLQRYR